MKLTIKDPKYHEWFDEIVKKFLAVFITYTEPKKLPELQVHIEKYSELTH